jgi:hypothetical protein
MFPMPVFKASLLRGTPFSKKNDKDFFGLLMPRNECRFAPPISTSIKTTLYPFPPR